MPDPIMLTIVRIVSCTTPILLLDLLMIFPFYGSFRVVIGVETSAPMPRLTFQYIAHGLHSSLACRLQIHPLQFRRKTRQQVNAFF
ncbi:Uncharacterised protein [Vibrio cholerae]|nr:Uncharacterised protein [Vibrio cholerae]CSB54783.1 Uncharacterised protein [Vibrio cholerae]CSB73081.1 Uncharacterised protein [Vibrio cholerae]CSC32006.1 Uncharacterised protein [Vibrio cholerae]CSC55054.1 Uncharacterised protein [Vibrio cholerae]